MTSSFGTVIGTPRDRLPEGLSSTNYDRVTPDLSKAVNDQIDKNIVDTKDFFADMMKIAQLRYDNRDNNLKALAEFSAAAAEFKQVSDKAAQIKEVYQKRKKQIDGIQQGVDEKNNLDVAEKEKEEFTDVAANELIQENTVESSDVAFVITRKDEEEASIQGKYSLDNLNFADINDTMVKKDAYNMTSLEASNSWDEVEENFNIAVFMDAEKNGINTKGRKWERYYIEKVIPKLETLKEKWMLGHETYKKNIVASGLNNKKKIKISEYINSEKPDTEALINYIIKTSPPGTTKSEAILDIATEIHNSLRNKDGRFSIQDAQRFKNELQFLDASKSTKDKPVYTNLLESNFGTKGSITTSALALINRGIDYATIDPAVEQKARKDRFITTVLPQFAEEDGSYTDKSKLAIMDAWQEEFGSTVPFDQSIMSLEAQSSTSNRFGTNYGAYSVPGQGDPFLDIYTEMEGELLSQVNDQKTRGSRYTKLPSSRKDELILAYADFKNLMNLSESGNQGLDNRQRIQENKDKVITKLLKGDYANKIKAPDFNTGQPKDIEADSNYFLEDKSRIDSEEFASPIEKNNLEISRAAIERGDIAGAYTPYWQNVSKKTRDPGTDCLLKR
jgi:hypothetical protein